MTPSATLSCVERLSTWAKLGSGEEVAPGMQEPNYNDTLKSIAKRKAKITAKEIGSIALPMAAGVGAGMGYEKFMRNRGGAGPGAKKLLAFSALPAVGLTVGTALRAAKDLKENEFKRIREEEMAKYENARQEYANSLQRTPQP